jgi:hypothetical protein
LRGISQQTAAVGFGRRCWRSRLALAVALGLVSALVSVAAPGVAQAAAPSWSVIPSPNQASSAKDELNSVSCVSASFCVAVGSYLNSTGTSRTLIESWNGSTWSIVASPDKFTGDNVLDQVSCVSASFCVAVGSWAKGRATLVESWNGSTWSIVPSPDKYTGDNSTDEQLLGVSCVSPTFCVAVGFWDVGVGAYSVLGESWDGSTWSIATTAPAASGSELTSVSCSSASSCTAVGWQGEQYSVGQPQKTLAESWDGSTWSIASSPNQTTNDNALAGVACLSATSCTAVGRYRNASSVLQTLVESWDGSTWSAVSSPDQGTAGNVLSGISCVSASSCVSVGSRGGGTRTLAESWDGSTWSVLSSPSPGSEDNQLLGVSCTAAASCVAVGDFTATNGREYTLIEGYS